MRRPDVASIRPRAQPAANNFEAFVTRHANDWLQFGRGGKPAETRQVNPFPADITSLQFGRGCKPAETGRGRGVRHARGARFNSAAAASPRNLFSYSLREFGGKRFNSAAGGKPAETSNRSQYIVHP